MTQPPHMDPDDTGLAQRAERRLREYRAQAEANGLGAKRGSPAEAMIWAINAIETLRAGVGTRDQGDEVSEFYTGGPAIPVRVVIGPDPQGVRSVLMLQTVNAYGVNGVLAIARAPGTETDVTFLEAHHPDQPHESAQPWSATQVIVRGQVGVLVRELTHGTLHALQRADEIESALETLRMVLNLDENGDPR